jgi:hypothetical protein
MEDVPLLQPSTTTPADQLKSLEAHIRSLTAQRTALHPNIITAIGAAYHGAAQTLGENGASTGVPLPSSPTGILRELVAVHASRQYLQYLQDLQALVRESEKAGRGVHRALADPAAFLDSVSHAVEAYSQGMGYAIALQGLHLEPSARADQLHDQFGALQHRLGAVEHLLHRALSDACQATLGAANWPPPLTLGLDSTPSGAGGGGWQGFGDPGVVQQLQRLFTVLLTLQRAAQHQDLEQALASPDPGGAKPVLWPALELAVPIGEQLQRHFGSGLPTDRVDKPEWLFACALKAVRGAAPLVDPFQSCVEAHDLHGAYSMQLEVAEAAQDAAVAPLLRSHVLPRLAGEGDDALWLHFADESIRYERR